MSIPQLKEYVFDDSSDFIISGDFADFTIRLGNTTWRLHRLILSERSGFFKRVCGGSFKVRAMIEQLLLERDTNLLYETTDQVVSLHDDDPHMLARAILFMYTGAFPVPDGHSTPVISKEAFDKLVMSIATAEDKVSGLLYHAHCYALGDKYDIPALKLYASSLFRLGLCECTVHQLFQSIKMVYTTALTVDDNIRKLVVYQIQKMWPISQHPEFRDFLKTIPDFAVDFGTRYHRAKLLVCCTTCNEYICLPEFDYSCDCGYNNICRIGPCCGNPELLDMYHICKAREISDEQQRLVPFLGAELIIDGHYRCVPMSKECDSVLQP